MDSNRKKILEEFARRVSLGDHSTRDFISKDLPQATQALLSRNLAEDALAHQVLKDTGEKIPRKNDFKAVEQFLYDQKQKFYPEQKNGVFRLEDSEALQKKFGSPVAGAYVPGNGFPQIYINKNELSKPNGLTSVLGSTFHEAGHGHDSQVLGYESPKELIQGHKSQLNIKDMYENAKKKDLDPTELFEIAAKGHHANIPDLREADSYGLGALKSYMKNGKFKQITGFIPHIGTALAGATALASPDASAAIGDALVPGGLESLGPHEMDIEIENPQKNPELRKEALKKLANKE